MRGRFTQRFSWREVHRFLDVTGPALNLRPRYNVAPGSCPAQGIAVQAVSTWVNKPANDDPRCIEALEDPPGLTGQLR